MSFVNDPGDEQETSFPQQFQQASSQIQSQTTPSKKRKKHKKKRQQLRKKQQKQKVKQDVEDNEDEVMMSKLMAVKQQKNPHLLISTLISSHQSTRWDVSAKSLLCMTLTFLRHVPEVCENFLHINISPKYSSFFFQF